MESSTVKQESLLVTIPASTQTGRNFSEADAVPTTRNFVSRPPASAKADADGDSGVPPGAVLKPLSTPGKSPSEGASPAAGLEELQTWLADLIRQGLAHARRQPASYFETMAARLAEAQTPGLARRLREWPAVFASEEEDWAGRALAEAGGLQRLLNGAAQLDELSAAARASVRAALGWTIDDQELLAAPGSEITADFWRVVGRRMEDVATTGGSRAQRTWLLGENTGRMALCLSFAAEGRPFDLKLVPGEVIDANITFYQGDAPLRGKISVRRDTATPPALTEPSAAARANFNEALDFGATLLAGDPWLEHLPWLVRGCVPQLAHPSEMERSPAGIPNETWTLRDAAGAVVPLARGFANAWPLLAASGGAPVTVFGEWDGRALLPLGVLDGDRFIDLGGTLP